MDGHYFKILPLFLVLFFCSCLNLKQPDNKILFYSLEYNPPAVTGNLRLPHVIRLERFSVSPIYNSTRIIYRDKSFKRDAYYYHKWRANPGDMVTYFLGRDLKKSGLFKAVLPYDSGFPYAYQVQGMVDEFFEWDGKDNSWAAVLAISITLMAENEPDITRKILFQKNYHSKKPCKQRNPAALTGAMSRAMETISAEIIMDIYSSLKDRM